MESRRLASLRKSAACKTHAQNAVGESILFAFLAKNRYKEIRSGEAA